ncbi:MULTISPECIES: hypothetical protein [Streptomyces]|uniref:DoxX family protein n=4 Tax=Streptomyces venezuelae TaxID=54571 RepID=F2RC41_STRVP|nr:hypothetical protein [Streptomyces venezuelae]CCA59292.1 hypothetical protein SVEN_6006 [Streptomyces venezuelae ATCC 10712]
MTVSSQVIPATPTATAAPAAPLSAPQAPLGRFDRLAPRLHRHGLVMLRAGLGGVFVWFGVLKVIGLSPAAALVVDVLPFPVGGWFVPALGWTEVALGLWLVSGRARALALPVLTGHLCGTFSVLVLTPSAAFAHSNPLLLTLVGEFVVKNVVLLAGVVVVTTHPRDQGLPAV